MLLAMILAAAEPVPSHFGTGLLRGIARNIKGAHFDYSHHDLPKGAPL
jgi:hypothetical protein